MTMVTNTKDLTVRESLWTMIVRQLGDSMGRLWDYLNQDLGPVEDCESNYPADGCCP